MRLARLGPVGAERPVLLDDDRVLDLSSLTADIDAACFAGGGLDRVRDALADGALPELAGAASLRVGAPADSLDHVAGFVVVDDLSERAFQLEASGGQWSKGKCAPGFAPTGPWLVTVDEVDHRALRLRSWVNGAPRQDSSTRDMVFDVEHLVWHLSQFMALEPGDLVLTGTPEGVALCGRFPYLQPGDVVEIEIDGLGRQRHELVATEGAR